MPPRVIVISREPEYFNDHVINMPSNNVDTYQEEVLFITGFLFGKTS
jgi:hypothetical protein